MRAASVATQSAVDQHVHRRPGVRTLEKGWGVGPVARPMSVSAPTTIDAHVLASAFGRCSTTGMEKVAGLGVNGNGKRIRLWR